MNYFTALPIQDADCLKKFSIEQLISIERSLFEMKILASQKAMEEINKLEPDEEFVQRILDVQKERNRLNTLINNELTERVEGILEDGYYNFIDVDTIYTPGQG